MTEPQTQKSSRGEAARQAAQVTYARRRARRHIRDMAAMPEGTWGGPASQQIVQDALVDLARMISVRSAERAK